MRADFRVVLDACVLIPMPLADTLLRFAETPRLYSPLWTDQIMVEVTTNLISKLGISKAFAERREAAVRKAFPEAWVEGYEPLIEKMENSPKDRHVLAAAVRSSSELIVTYNTKHFPARVLLPWRVEAQGPSTFLIGLYDLDPALAIHKLHGQAESIGSPFGLFLQKLHKAVPAFVEYICSEQAIDLPT